MINLVSMLAVMMLLGGAIFAIVETLRGHAEVVVAALAGRSLRAEVLITPAPRVRVTIRTPKGRTIPLQPLRAAA
jgi:hypothetical protein